MCAARASGGHFNQARPLSSLAHLSTRGQRPLDYGCTALNCCSGFPRHPTGLLPMWVSPPTQCRSTKLLVLPDYAAAVDCGNGLKTVSRLIPSIRQVNDSILIQTKFSAPFPWPSVITNVKLACKERTREAQVKVNEAISGVDRKVHKGIVPFQWMGARVELPQYQEYQPYCRQYTRCYTVHGQDCHSRFIKPDIYSLIGTNRPLTNRYFHPICQLMRGISYYKNPEVCKISTPLIAI